MKSHLLSIITSTLIIITTFTSCERDDICAESTPTTPLLVIDFYDIDNPTELKAPSGFTVIENGSDSGRSFTATSLSIPLRTDLDNTEFLFTINSTNTPDDTNPPNTDIINFAYTRTEEYVSKACGYRVLFDNLEQLTSGQSDDLWIQNIEVINNQVSQNETAHIHIFH